MALSDSLISFWELEEASGTRIDSVVASGNDLSDGNTVTQNTGKVGNCAQLTAANAEYLSRASNASLVTGDIDFSFAGWVYFDSFPSLSDFVSKTDTAQWEYDLFCNGAGQIHWYVEGTSSFDQIFIDYASLSTWIFIAVWHDAVNDRIGGSINDGTPATHAYGGGVRSTSHPFIIGARSVAGQWLDGRLDQWGFWKKVLSPAEITQLYNGGAGLSYAAIAGVTSEVWSWNTGTTIRRSRFGG